MKNKHPLWANLFQPANKQQAEIDNLWMETPLFAGIPPRHIRPITKALSLRHYSADEIIFKTGEIGIGAALIVNGRVSIQASDHKLATLERGDIFGEVALATDETRTADAIAEKPSALVFFMKQDLDDLIKQHPVTAAKFAVNLAKMLAIRLRHVNSLQKQVGN